MKFKHTKGKAFKLDCFLFFLLRFSLEKSLFHCVVKESLMIADKWSLSSCFLKKCFNPGGWTGSVDKTWQLFVVVTAVSSHVHILYVWELLAGPMGQTQLNVRRLQCPTVNIYTRESGGIFIFICLMPVEVQSNQLNALSVILLVLALVALLHFPSHIVLETEKLRFGDLDLLK